MSLALSFTFDPLDPILLLFNMVWFVIAAAMLVLAARTTSEWLKATLGAFALSILGWHLLAVLPSWWLYFAESRLNWGGQGCVEFVIADLGDTSSDTWSCVLQSAKDVVVVVQNAIVVGLFVVGFLIFQRKYPKQLAPGEPKPEATGGYK